MLFTVVLIVEAVDANAKSYLHSNESCWTGESFPLILFSTLNNVILTSESLGEISKCYHSNESKLHYFSLMLFILLTKVIVTVDSAIKYTGKIYLLCIIDGLTDCCRSRRYSCYCTSRMNDQSLSSAVNRLGLKLNHLLIGCYLR